MFENPTPVAVASPPDEIVATGREEEVQVAEAVRFCLLPSLYVPVALNSCVFPAGTEAVEGVNETETSTGAVTVKVVDPDIPPTAAVTTDVPIATPVAEPPAWIVATARAEELQAVEDVRFCVLPSL
jgi:hypothetical protein